MNEIDISLEKMVKKKFATLITMSFMKFKKT